jgi:hypothetical protein
VSFPAENNQITEGLKTMITMEQIAVLANKKGVRKIAVENVLMGLQYQSEMIAGMNFSQDKALYKWNAATCAAIRKGMRIHYGKS